jgi:hypothetical protein
MVEIACTQKGHPALWEKGGGYTSTGYAQIICAADGSPKAPVYIRRRGHLACGEHALFVVKEGDVVVQASHHRRDFKVEILKISKIMTETEQKVHPGGVYYSFGETKEKALEIFACTKWGRDGHEIVTVTETGDPFFRYAVEYAPRTEIITRHYAVLEPLATFDMGEWDNEEIAVRYEDAIRAAMEKATCYHCREPHFILTE